MGELAHLHLKMGPTVEKVCQIAHSPTLEYPPDHNAIFGEKYLCAYLVSRYTLQLAITLSWNNILLLYAKPM